MPKVEYMKLMEVAEVLSLIKGLEQVGECIQVPLWDAYGKILSQDLLSPEDLPHFRRATMDGYALIARDTFGASPSMPALLELKGHVRMGDKPDFFIEPGTCCAISTGGMLPEGADAVLMIEHSHEVDQSLIEVLRPVAVGENVIQEGEDISKGTLVLRGGKRLSAADLGLLAALGITKVHVRRPLTVSIISTGDEVVDPEETPALGKIRDVNSITLYSLVKALGHNALYLGRSKDEFGDLKDLVTRGLRDSDMVLISGGSSVGTRDLTLGVLSSFDGFHLLCHGIMISPGKPTIFGTIGKKPVLGLPGHVASAFVVMLVVVRPIIRYLSGIPFEEAISYFSIKARAARNIESQPGREDYVRVRLIREDDKYVVDPLFGKSGLISTIVQGDGLIKIPTYSEGVYEGDEVEFIPFATLLGEA